jgi:hypothetical protein
MLTATVCFVRLLSEKGVQKQAKWCNTAGDIPDDLIGLSCLALYSVVVKIRV